MNMPYNYEPLFKLLECLDMTLDDIYERKILSSKTVEKIANNEQVMASTVAKICIALGCSFDDVIALNITSSKMKRSMMGQITIKNGQRKMM